MGESGADLSVFVDCHGLVLAMPVRQIERLVLSEEVVLTRRSQGVPIAVAGSTRYAAWSLGRLLEVGPLETAWVLLRLPHEGGELPLALSTGRCLLVAPLTEEVAALPPGLFRGRPAALWGTFPVNRVKGSKLKGVMGLCLDPQRLWSSQELALSAVALASAHDS
jgi:hypothetical protein